MSSKKATFFISTGLAFFSTLALYWIDSQRAAERDTGVALQIARQIATQAAGLAFEYKAKGEFKNKQDAFIKAVELVNQGQDPRVVKVFPLRKLASQESETYFYEPRSGVLEYAKTLSPEEGKGIRVLVEMGARKFLGATNAFQNDGGLFLVFCVFWFFSFFGLKFFGFSKINQNKNKIIQKWIIEMRSMMVRLGVNIREVLKNTETLFQSASQSQNSMVQLHEKIHRGLSELHLSGKSLKEAESQCEEARHSLVELWGEIKKLDGQYPEIYEKIKKLAKSIEKMKKTTREGVRTVSGLELQIEPWAQEADFALKSFEKFTQSSEAVSGHVKNTADVLLGQAQLFNTMSSEVKPQRQRLKAFSKK